MNVTMQQLTPFFTLLGFIALIGMFLLGQCDGAQTGARKERDRLCERICYEAGHDTGKYRDDSCVCIDMEETSPWDS